MHRLTPLAIAFVLTAAVFAEDSEPKAGVVELGGEHAVLAAGTLSADGRYAAGFTFRPKKGKPAVDWDKIAKDEEGALSYYVGSEDHDTLNVIVDLQQRAIVAPLKFADPWFPHKSHGGFEVVYGPERDGRRFVIVVNKGKWQPSDVRLLDLGPDGAKQNDLQKTLDAAVTKYLRSKARSRADRYVANYDVADLPERGLISGFANANVVRIPFTAEVPKEDDASRDGIVQLRLAPGPRAEIVEIRPGDFDPTQDHPDVAAADKELNAAYGALRPKLDADAKAGLVQEQRTWIEERDAKIAELEKQLNEAQALTNPRHATDRLLAKLTRERAAALRAKAE